MSPKSKWIATLAAICLGIAAFWIVRPYAFPNSQARGPAGTELPKADASPRPEPITAGSSTIAAHPADAASRAADAGFVGSASCRSCHEKFYQLWAPSWHGLAMQPFSPELARNKLTTQPAPLEIEGTRYIADLNAQPPAIRESGPAGERSYPVEHVMGGKNVYYFLTPADRGRLQVLPIAYDVRRKEWLDTSASGMRHFGGVSEGRLDWRHPLYTFNTSCYNCHVSQLQTNYNAQADTYHTVWAEPGINCEACHGPAGEHVRVCREAPPGKPPADLHLILLGKAKTVEQNNTACSVCHAKMMVVSPSFRPGDRLWDHYGLSTLENPDYYPDGRDLGENYTYTSWLMSPCVKSGQLGCLHCHTSSGRYRFREGDPNAACLPCHESKVADAPAHTRHKAGSKGNECVSCHMPMTEFARMLRSDHSMRPPMPSATKAFKSPNACNICHTDRDADWADQHVRQWRSRDYQAPVLKIGHLIAAARRGEWANLAEMQAYIVSPGRDEIFANSLVRLIRTADREDRWPVFIQAARDRSPLIRASAMEALAGRFTHDSLPTLLAGTRDEYRLVRVRAAAGLAGIRPELVPAEYAQAVMAATAEYMAAMTARPDDSSSQFDLGNFFASLGDLPRAVKHYDTAARLLPENLPALVNGSLAYSALGDNVSAERNLRQAVKIEPNSAAPHFNLGLLLAELGRKNEAETELRTALKLDPRSAQAAHNLGVLVAERDPAETVKLCRQAYELQPAESKYGYTLAFYLLQTNDLYKALEVLKDVTQRSPAAAEAWLLLADVHTRIGDQPAAVKTLQSALQIPDIPPQARTQIEATLRSLDKSD